MPTRTPVPAAEATLRAVEAAIHRGGWDQPHYFALVASPAEVPLEVRHDSEVLHVDVPAAGLEACVFELGRCDAHDALFGTSAPAWAAAVVLVAEAWMAPAVDPAEWSRQPAPSQHPRRRELRQAAWVDRDGPVEVLLRHRGDQPEMSACEVPVFGRIPEVLLRVMGRPVEPTHPFGAFLARSWVAAVVALAERVETLTWADVLALAPSESAAGTWEEFLAAPPFADPETAAVAAWVGPGMAANRVVWAQPTVADQLETLAVLAGTDIAGRLRAELAARGLDDRSYAELAAVARRQPRNSRCGCGSGQKAKHCCAAA